MGFSVFVMMQTMLYFATINAKQYTIEFRDIGALGGSTNVFKLMIEGTGGSRSDPLTINYGSSDICLYDSANAPCYYNISADVGTAKYLYMMTMGDDLFLLDEIVVDGTLVNEFGYTYLEYTGSDLFGCEVAIINISDNSIETRVEEPTCYTFPPTPTPEPTQMPTTTPEPTKTPTLHPNSVDADSNGIGDFNSDGNSDWVDTLIFALIIAAAIIGFCLLIIICWFMKSCEDKLEQSGKCKCYTDCCKTLEKCNMPTIC
eukprot:440145_1